MRGDVSKEDSGLSSRAFFDRCASRNHWRFDPANATVNFVHGKMHGM
jgi:hypothetical protein